MTNTNAARADWQTIAVERRGPVEWLTLNRPQALNTLNAAMAEDLGAYFAALEAASDVRVVVLRGSGRAFCAGLDIKEMAGRIELLDRTAIFAFQRALSRIIVAMRRCPQPIVGLIHGAACGGGMALALACDIRFATPDARMAVAANQVGLSGCDVGLSYLLPKLVGAAVAARLLLTSEFLLAPRARELGLFAEVVAATDIEATASAVVDDMLRVAPLALALTKQGLHSNLSAPSLEAAIEIEDRQQAMLASDREFLERMRAFTVRSRQG